MVIKSLSGLLRLFICIIRFVVKKNYHQDPDHEIPYEWFKITLEILFPTKFVLKVTHSDYWHPNY